MSEKLAQALDEAVQFCQEGRFDEAATRCDELLSRIPTFWPAMKLRAMIALEQGNLRAAATDFARALKLHGDPEMHAMLGEILQRQGELDKARAAYEHAIALRADFPQALANLCAVLTALGEYGSAQQIGRRAVEVKADSPSAWCNLGNAYREGRKLAEAEAAYRRAVELRPDIGGYWSNLGVALREQRRLVEAIQCLERSVELAPHDSEALSNLGVALHSAGRFDEAVRTHQRAVLHTSDDPEVLANLANALRSKGALDEATEAYDQALAIDPHRNDIRWNRAICVLLRGHLQQGFREYEWRHHRNRTPPAPLDRAWDGTALHGRQLLLDSEQGLGDSLQFLRFARLVHDLGAEVTVRLPASLVAIGRTVEGVDHAIALDAKPAYDLRAYLHSVPALLGLDETCLPPPPYIVADPARVDHWGARLSKDRFRIAIGWQGNRGYELDHLRSPALREFAPLAGIANVEWIAVQKGEGVAQLNDTPEGMRVVSLGPELDNDGAAFVDTAAVLANVDLVITSDSALAHLSGAMDRPAWIALPFAPDWRWQLGTSTTPWYPKTRLFRQPRPGDWRSVFEEIAQNLATLVSSRG